MAWSGSGSGTLASPYMITNVGQITEMADQSGGSYIYAGDYFKLANDISMGATQFPLIGQHFDGDGKRLYNWNKNPAVGPSTGVVSGSSFTNVKCEVSVGTLGYFFPNAGTASNVTITDVEIEIGYLAYVLAKVNPTWIIERVKCYGDVRSFIKSSQSTGQTPNLTDIYVLNKTSYCFLVEANCNSVIYRCQLVQMATSFQRTSVVKTLVSGGVVRQCLAIALNAGKPDDTDYNAYGMALVDTPQSGSLIEDCLVTVYNLHTNRYRELNRHMNLALISGNYSYSPTIKNSVAVIHNAVPVQSFIEPWFDDLGYTDWYVPSIDELELIRQTMNSGGLDYWSINSGLGFDYMSSTEVDANNCYVKRLYSSTPLTVTKSGYYSGLILVRNLVEIPAELGVGDEYEGTKIIYKDGTTGIGMAKRAVANGYNIFSFGSTGSLLGTSSSVGSGKANTALMGSALSDPAGATDWIEKYLYSPVEMNFLGHIPDNASNSGLYQVFGDNDYDAIDEANDMGFYSLSAASVSNKKASQLKNSAEFSALDFLDTWAGGDGTSEIYLKNNDLADFGTPIALCNVHEVERTGSTQFSIALYFLSISPGATYGVELYFGGTLLSDKENQATFSVSDSSEGIYELKPYVKVDGIKTYGATYIYEHFTSANAVKAPIPLSVTTQPITTFPLRYPHGLCYYNGYAYAGIRNNTILPTPLVVCKVNVDDITDYIVTRIRPASELLFPDSYYEQENSSSAYGENLEQLVVCRGYVYGVFSCVTGVGSNYLLQYNPTTNAYKVFAVNAASTTVPILTDGEYLYFISLRYVAKVHPLQFEQAPNQFYTESVFPTVVEATYDSALQGGYALGLHPEYYTKGLCHSAIADDEYLYVNYTTGAHSGYDAGLGISVHECHKIKKSDMTPAGYANIPKSTDDCCQTETHIFHGIEVQPGADPNTYGYGWGAFAVRKSDMAVLGIKKLHETDDPPSVTSYASLIFGNYLIDSKTNKKIYIIDISDVDNWSLSDPAGKYTLDVFDYTPQGISTINEMILASQFIGTIWNKDGAIAAFNLAGYNFFIAPIVSTRPAVIEGTDVIFKGWISNAGNLEITARGFRYGTSIEDLSQTVLSSDTIDAFEGEVTLPVGTYYYQAYATNSEGTGYGSIVQVEVVELHASAPTAFGSTSEIQVLLSWDDPEDMGVGTLLGFKIERKTQDGSEWNTIYQNTELVEYSYVDTVEAGSYDYRVTAITTEGVSPYYATQSIDVSSGSGGGGYRIYIGTTEASIG